MINTDLIIYTAIGVVMLMISTLLYITFQSKDMEISELKEAISRKEILVAKLESSNAQVEVLVAKQNEAIKEITTDRNSALSKLEEWRAKPPKVRYEVIYKDREVVKSNECEDIKNHLGSVRTIDFNSL